MSQYRAGTVTVQQNAPTVWAVWQVRVSVARAFQLGLQLDFDGGAVGLCVGWDSVNLLLKFTVVSTLQPILGEGFHQGGLNSTISSFVVAPDFGANVAPGDLFIVRGEVAPYYVAQIDTISKLTLTAPYAGTGGQDLPYAIHRSFTPDLGIPYPEPGDVEITTIVKAQALAIERTLQNVQAIGQGGPFLGNERKSIRIKADGTGLELFEAAVAGAASDIDVAGDLTVAGSTALTGDAITGNVVVGGTLGVTGIASLGVARILQAATFFNQATFQSTSLAPLFKALTALGVQQGGRFQIAHGTANSGVAPINVEVLGRALRIWGGDTDAQVIVDFNTHTIELLGNVLRDYANLDTGTATEGTANLLTDASKAWGNGVYTGKRIILTGGAGAGQIRGIQSHTATTITPDLAWSPVPGASTTYRIVDPAEDRSIGRRPYSVFKQMTADPNSGHEFAAVTNAWAPQAIPDLGNIAIPGANGARQYRVRAQVMGGLPGASQAVYLNVHVGPLGTVDDPLVVQRFKQVWTGTWDVATIDAARITPATGDRLTLAVKCNAQWYLVPFQWYDQTNGPFHYGSFVEIEEVL